LPGRKGSRHNGKVPLGMGGGSGSPSGTAKGGRVAGKSKVILRHRILTREVQGGGGKEKESLGVWRALDSERQKNQREEMKKRSEPHQDGAGGAPNPGKRTKLKDILI